VKPSRPRPKKRAPAPTTEPLPKLLGFWDLDASGNPYFAGTSRAAMRLTGERLERGDYRIWHTAKETRWVSTIFLWINHQWDSTQAPILFETAAYCGGKITICERYTTRMQARAGHRKWCKTYLDS